VKDRSVVALLPHNFLIDILKADCT